MRVSLVTALVCAAVLASLSPASAQMSFTRGFDGGSVKCTTSTIRTLEPVSWKAPKQHREGSAVFDVETLEGARHRYIFTGTTVKVSRRSVGRMSKAFGIKAWDFDCRVQTDVGVSHTCTNLQGVAGRCTVCSDDGCTMLTFRVSRQKA